MTPSGDEYVREITRGTTTGRLVEVSVYRDSWGEYCLDENGKKCRTGQALTESGWLGVDEPGLLLYQPQVLASLTPRKMRLISVACCKLLLPLLPDPSCEKALRVAEQYADGEVTEQGRIAARRAARSVAVSYAGVRTRLGDGPWAIARGIRQALDKDCSATIGFSLAECASDPAAMKLAQADVVRHMVGNPFRRYPVQSTRPDPVIRLAESLYQGEPCGFALHDALLETGHPDLAAHFSAERSHPRGCWVLDMILDKE